MVHIIIVTHDKWLNLKRLILLIAQLDSKEFRIHVADNLGDVELENQINRYCNFSYYSYNNIGYGLAINSVLGLINRLENDLFIFSNDDVFFEIEDLKNLIMGYESQSLIHDKIGIVCPVFKTKYGKSQIQYYENYRKSDTGLSEVDFVPGAFWLVDNNYLKIVGGFLPFFFMYGEDKELCFRGKYYGMQNYVVEGSCVYHDFHYPTQTKHLRVLHECNVISAHYINNNKPKVTWYKFVILGIVTSLRDYSLRRLSYILLGTFWFFRKIAILKNIKSEHKKQVNYRYLSL
jgi:GT2 family glycosyltransferase